MVKYSVCTFSYQWVTGGKSGCQTTPKHPQTRPETPLRFHRNRESDSEKCLHLSESVLGTASSTPSISNRFRDRSSETRPQRTDRANGSDQNESKKSINAPAGRYGLSRLPAERKPHACNYAHVTFDLDLSSRAGDA